MNEDTLDLNEAPYRQYVELLETLRASSDARAQVSFREARDEERGTHDANEQDRARLAHVMLLHSTPSDLDLVRFLLDQEIAARRADSFQGAGDTLTILSLLLLEYGDREPDDTWRFWLAKRANFDTVAGGYDIEFVFSQLAPPQVLKLVEARAPAGELDMLERYDTAEIVGGLHEWRAAVTARYPRTQADLTPYDCENWAELFGDQAGLERFGLQNAPTPEARAYHFRRLGRYSAAVVEWREAAAGTTDAWDRASLLQRAVSDAAKVPLDNAERCSSVLDLVRRLQGRSNQNAASDLAVAGALARTALQGCLANVAINVESIKDEHTAAGLAARASELRTALDGVEAAHG